MAPGATVTLAEISGPGIIEHIWITVTDHTEADTFVLRDLVLRMYWDDETEPSVESPLGDFFCNGFGRGCTVNSQPIVVNPTRGFNCYFPMPFRSKARIEIENQHEASIPAFFYQIDYCLHDELPEDTAYFHAQWKRQRITDKAEDYIILDNVKGRGQYVGTYMALTTLERYWWGEGEIKMYIDGDKEYPTICGTGTEDYFGVPGALRLKRTARRSRTRTARHTWAIPTIPAMTRPSIIRTTMTMRRPCVDFTAGTFWTPSGSRRI